MIWIILYLSIGLVLYWRTVNRYSDDPDDLLLPILLLFEPFAWIMFFFWPFTIWILKEEMKFRVQNKEQERKKQKEIKLEKLSEIVSIGSTGTAIADLIPSGMVDIDGKRYFAISEGAAPIERGTRVIVIDHSMGTLTIRKAEQ